MNHAPLNLPPSSTNTTPPSLPPRLTKPHPFNFLSSERGFGGDEHHDGMMKTLLEIERLPGLIFILSDNDGGHDHEPNCRNKSRPHP